MQEAVEESVFHVKKGGLIVSRGFFFHPQRLGGISLAGDVKKHKEANFRKPLYCRMYMHNRWQ